MLLCAILIRPATPLLELAVISAMLIQPAFLVIPMRSLAVVRWTDLLVCRENIMTDLVDIWDLALKDPDTMRVLQQNQQLAVPAAIIILVAQTTIMAVLTIMVTRA